MKVLHFLNLCTLQLLSGFKYIYIFHMGLYNSQHCFIKSLGVVVCNNCTIVKFDVVAKANACESSVDYDLLCLDPLHMPN